MKILYGEELVNQLRKNSDSIKKRLWIAVPYIGGLKSVRSIIGRNWIDDSSLSVRLLTDKNEFNIINLETIKKFNISGEIRHLSGLHAKIYITDNTCLVTSANLTNAGFSRRDEIGVLLDDASSQKTISIFKKWWGKSEKIPLKDIRVISKKKSNSSEEKSGSAWSTQWKLPEDPGEINYWLKPMGVSNNGIKEGTPFDAKEQKLNFSKQEPKGVKINDIIITYGVGAKKRILSIYKVITKPVKVLKPKTSEDWENRWPWEVKGKNLTPHFGKKWVLYNIDAYDICKQYMKKTPNGYITKVKGVTLGSINYGKDKINLNAEFARYIIKKVNQLDDKH